MRMTIRCTECGKSFTGRDETEAGLKFDDHECVVDYASLSDEELKAMIGEAK